MGAGARREREGGKAKEENRGKKERKWKGEWRIVESSEEENGDKEGEKGKIKERLEEGKGKRCKGK